jgi:hypothetical protein
MPPELATHSLTFVHPTIDDLGAIARRIDLLADEAGKSHYGRVLRTVAMTLHVQAYALDSLRTALARELVAQQEQKRAGERAP